MIGMPPEFPDASQPLVIPEQHHPIRQNMIDADAVFIMRKLNKAGFSSYLVGGGVRDLYLGKTPKDFDISTDARPGQIRKIFPNSSTIGRRFRLVQVFFKFGKVIEISTLRSLSEHDLDGPEAVLAPNNTYGNLPEDAQRRDLSINSLFYELENHTIIDYVNGVSDLDNSIIRMIGEPDKRINRDPVRMMRAIRHGARTGFSIEDETWRSIRRNHDKIALCPPSRIRDELLKDLYGGSAGNWFDLAVDSNIFSAIFPFYRDILSASPPNQPTCREQLKTILEMLDSINRGDPGERGKYLPKHFILALLLLPWAEMTYDLTGLNIKSAGIYQLSKKMRSEIDNLLGVQLNLRRSIRQEMVILLSNLPQFVPFVQNDTWPKWLRKKSYFTDCLLFSHFHHEITSGGAKKKELIDLINRIPHTPRSSSPKTEFYQKKSRPAFSPKKKGGVFGFRKKPS
jgi:poly(A) polymerase